MKNITAFVAALCLLLGLGCSKPQLKSSDQMAEELLKQLPQAAAERPLKPAAAVSSIKTPFSFYTWQVVQRAGKPVQIVLYGENLTGAAALLVGEERLALEVAKDGRSAIGSYPEKPSELPVPMSLLYQEVEYALSEPFSTLKPQGLPSIGTCRFAWERVTAPAWVQNLGGKEVEALRFQCETKGYEPRNAPLTAYFGDLAVFNNQITESENQLMGYVYVADSLKSNIPVCVDFGQGLRVMAPRFFVLPEKGK